MKNKLIWVCMFLLISPIVYSQDEQTFFPLFGDSETYALMGDNEFGVFNQYLPPSAVISPLGPGTGSGVDSDCDPGYTFIDGKCVPIQKEIEKVITAIKKGKYNPLILLGFMVICLIGIFFYEKEKREKAREKLEIIKGKVSKGKEIIKEKLEEEGFIAGNNDRKSG